MRCPFCGNIDTQVKDSRPAEDHVAIRRRRFCAACVGRFTTYERVQLRDLVVIKSNGRREDFDRDKLERSIRIALQRWRASIRWPMCALRAFIKTFRLPMISINLSVN